MDLRHAEHLKPGARVAVPMGAGVSEVYGTPPIVTTATVMAEVEGEYVWLAVDIAQGETLPQRYRVEEVVGFLMPMAVVTRYPDGSTEGMITDYVGP